jgi:hypothetical protein
MCLRVCWIWGGVGKTEGAALVTVVNILYGKCGKEEVYLGNLDFVVPCRQKNKLKLDSDYLCCHQEWGVEGAYRHS